MSPHRLIPVAAPTWRDVPWLAFQKLGLNKHLDTSALSSRMKHPFKNGINQYDLRWTDITFEYIALLL